MTRHYPELGRFSDWSCRAGNLIQPIRSTTQVISMEFLRSFLRRHLAGKPMIASLNVGCFLRLTKMLIWCFYLIVLQKCDHILTELWAQDESCPFARPVDKKQVERHPLRILYFYIRKRLSLLVTYVMRITKQLFYHQNFRIQLRSLTNLEQICGSRLFQHVPIKARHSRPKASV